MTDERSGVFRIKRQFQAGKGYLRAETRVVLAPDLESAIEGSLQFMPEKQRDPSRSTVLSAKLETYIDGVVNNNGKSQGGRDG